MLGCSVYSFGRRGSGISQCCVIGTPSTFVSLCLTSFAHFSKSSVPGNGVSRTKDVKDRKSTRLNSSHQIISYAVFCLKKKKKDHYTSEGRIPSSVVSRSQQYSYTVLPTRIA